MREFVAVVDSDDAVPPDGGTHLRIATLLLSRPPTNALTRQVYREIAEAAAELGGRDDVAAVIVFGGHEIFSAGEDMPELQTLTADEADVAAQARHACGGRGELGRARPLGERDGGDQDGRHADAILRAHGS